ncbi:hypothetical protein HPB50_010439 [Hyalomma asiaticum]|uniref:Uncharacterized protein n=1 Tax=Hyalomma asiaticum TaxID=266040 RepID=A0ACB7T1E2_HYAAI|nr:hypothetical protein HPB50_010439 [Hyalomma asiaticum]
MKQGKKQQLATYEKLRETISAKLSEVCSPGVSSASHSGATPLPDHGYALPAAQECVVYYLCGYIVHSFLKHVDCAACISSIQSTNTQCPASLLTLAREFRSGSLKYPSTELYTMFKGVEEKLSLVLEENHLCADMFWDALDVIKDCDVPSVGNNSSGKHKLITSKHPWNTVSTISTWQSEPFRLRAELQAVSTFIYAMVETGKLSIRIR